jgi:hypothetical protein
VSKVRQDSDLGPAGHGPYGYGRDPGGCRPPRKLAGGNGGGTGKAVLTWQPPCL